MFLSQYVVKEGEPAKIQRRGDGVVKVVVGIVKVVVGIVGKSW